MHHTAWMYNQDTSVNSHILATATIMPITVLCYAARINISYYITFF